jgi:hypothetical protein
VPAMTREELLWQKLVDEAGEELVEQAAAVSVEQAEKELAEAGFDVAAERARAEAFLLSLEGTAEETKPAAAEAVARAVAQDAPKRRVEGVARGDRRKVPPAVWLAAAAVTAGAAVAYVETRPEPGTPPVPSTPPSTTPPSPSPDLVAAGELRRRAAVACSAGRADVCLALLDQARAKDPAGDTTPEVARLREQAGRALEAKPR